MTAYTFYVNGIYSWIVNEDLGGFSMCVKDCKVINEVYVVEAVLLLSVSTNALTIEGNSYFSVPHHFSGLTPWFSSLK